MAPRRIGRRRFVAATAALSTATTSTAFVAAPFVRGAHAAGKLSLAMYVAGIPLSFVHPWLGYGIYVAVAAIWFIPDRRIERVLKE